MQNVWIFLCGCLLFAVGACSTVDTPTEKSKEVPSETKRNDEKSAEGRLTDSREKVVDGGGQERTHTEEKSFESPKEKVSPEPQFEAERQTEEARQESQNELLPEERVFEQGQPEQQAEQVPEKTAEAKPDGAAWGFSILGSATYFFNSSKVVQGVKVCVLGHPKVKCDTTSAQGLYTLRDVPEDKELYLTFTSTTLGLMPYMESLYVRSTEIPTDRWWKLKSGLVTVREAKYVAGLLGVQNLDLTNKAHVASQMMADRITPQGGGTISILPKAGTGPFYINLTGKPPSKSTDPGTGIGVFFNVTPGTYEFGFNHPTKKCKAHPNVIAGTQGRAKLKLQPGWLYFTNGICQ